MLPECVACRQNVNTYCSVNNWVSKHGLFVRDMFFEMCDVSPTDGDFMCQKCYFILDDAYAFKKQYLAAQVKEESVQSNTQEPSPKNDTPKVSTQKSFTCLICDYASDSKSDIRQHMLAYERVKKVKKFSRVKCKYSPDSDMRRVHLQKRDTIEFLPCNYCDFVTLLESKLKQHMLTHKNNITILEHAYSKHPSYTKQYMPSHKRVKVVKTHANEQCEDATNSSRNLKKQKLIQNNIKNPIFTCKFCKYSTHLVTDMKQHIHIHQNVKNIKTLPQDNSENATDLEPGLKERTLEHENIIVFPCVSCDYVTIWECDLKQHMLTHKNIETMPHEYSEHTPNSGPDMKPCMSSHKRVEIVNPHSSEQREDAMHLSHNSKQQQMLTHKNIETIPHEYSEHTSNSGPDMKPCMPSHKRVEIVKPHDSEQREDAMNLSHNSKQQQMLTNHNIKNLMFTCKVCKYATNQVPDLKKHILIHQNVKNVKTPPNDNSKCATNLEPDSKERIITLQDVKSNILFKCAYCDYVTFWEFALKKHMVTHTNVKPVKKLSCDNRKLFPNLYRLLETKLPPYDNLTTIETIECKGYAATNSEHNYARTNTSNDQMTNTSSHQELQNNITEEEKHFT